ncbi:TetR/AcrR family transcriptional regulator [Oceanisphaera ostreae]|uniref:TetR/AcrR family transcriptional regulator n=1 Tax=Oceanisphaera ostreae TaxID=914151 RepID=A0ABW3KL38_9GAMM
MKSTKYDRQEAIHNATNLFWANGFHATSMRNIQQAIDMRPGSIYASFGSKEGLYKEAMQHYTAMSKARLIASVAASASPFEGLKQFIKNAVVGGQTCAPSNLCMLVKTISELTDDNAELLAEAKHLLQEMESAFASILVKAQQQDEVDTTRSPARLARYLQVQLMGLRAYARTNTDVEQLNDLIDDVFDNLAKSARSPKVTLKNAR